MKGARPLRVVFEPNVISEAFPSWDAFVDELTGKPQTIEYDLQRDDGSYELTIEVQGGPTIRGRFYPMSVEQPTD